MSQKTIVKYKNLELLCKPNTISKYRDGKLSIDKVLLSDEIYKSVQKGNRTNAKDLENTFGTNNINECIKIMLDKGDYQISTEERKEKVTQKRSEIIGYIHRNYIDPKTKSAIPITRIESGLDTIKAKIDFETPVDKLLQPILKKLPTILPMKKQEGVTGKLKIQHYHINNVSKIIKKYCNIRSEKKDYQGYTYEVSMTPSDNDELIRAISKITEDDFQFELL